jgi:hypothetical protein
LFGLDRSGLWFCNLLRFSNLLRLSNRLWFSHFLRFSSLLWLSNLLRLSNLQGSAGFCGSELAVAFISSISAPPRGVSIMTDTPKFQFVSPK